MLKELDGYDWGEAFFFAANCQGSTPNKFYDLSTFTRDDVLELYGISEGENDGQSWVCYGKLKDGRYFSLNANCDYTGWECQAGGNSFVATSKEEIETFGLTEDYRSRMNVILP